MRRTLERCAVLDGVARDAYRAFAGAADDPDLAALFARLADHEAAQVERWSELLGAWERGLVPESPDALEIETRVDSLTSELSDLVPSDVASLTVDRLLRLSAHLEFCLLDASFAELAELAGTRQAREHRDLRRARALELAEAIERHGDDASLSRFLASVLRRASEDQRLIAELETRDPLTGTYNRRGVTGQVGHWLSWAARYKTSLAVILVDVDHLKRINDVHGHDAGDRALKHIADVLAAETRASDIVGRYSGDEFLVIAPETGREDLAALLQRIVTAVAEESVALPGGEVRVTASAGGAWVERGRECTSEQLIAAADRSLSSAKQSGRDRAGLPLEACEV